MSYCPTCGRQRAGNAQYCGGCGRDFGVGPMPPSIEPTSIEPTVAESAAAEPASMGPEVADPASTVPGAESDAGLPRLDPAAGEPQPTVTVMAGRPPPPASPPPSPPPPSLASLELETMSEWAEPAGSPPRGPRRGRVPTLWILLAVIVPLVAGGGTFGLVKLASQHAAGPGAAPASTAVTTAPTQPATTQPVSPSPSPSPSASPSPSVSPSVVSVGPGVANAPPGVEVVLSHYFQGINDRDYAEYASSQTAQGKANQPESSFDAGYATTSDTGMTLTSLTPTGGGDLTATVAFTSQQSPSDSVDNSACNDWTLNLYLVPDGAGYLITPAPSDYEPTYTDC